MKRFKHWQDPANALLGAWLVISPWAIGYLTDARPTWNAYVVGLLLIVAALGAMMVPKAWEEWTEAVLGVWLIIAPWMLSFHDNRPARVTAVVVGIVVALLSLWTLMTDRDYSGWLHREKVPHS